MRLCRLLDDDPVLAASVGGAAADPAEFFTAHEDELRARGVASPADVDPWLVIIDGLDEAGALAYLDPDDTGMELADALAGVPRVFRAGIDLEPVADVDELDAAIMRADALLAPHALRIVYLAEEPDACPLVVVPAAHADEIVALAAGLGREARVFG